MVHLFIDLPWRGDLYIQHDLNYGSGFPLSTQDQCDACKFSGKYV